VTLATHVFGRYVDEVLTMDRSGSRSFYHQNTLWSPHAVSDGAGNVVERYFYDAYGKVTITDGLYVAVPPNSWGTPHSGIGNRVLFTGREFDEETGFYFYRARYYDAAKGRFLQRDPLGYVDGMNLYEFVRGQPTRQLDPSGLVIYDIDPASPNNAPWAWYPLSPTVSGKTAILESGIRCQVLACCEQHTDVERYRFECTIRIRMLILINPVESNYEAQQTYGHEQRHVKNINLWAKQKLGTQLSKLESKSACKLDLALAKVLAKSAETGAQALLKQLLDKEDEHSVYGEPEPGIGYPPLGQMPYFPVPILELQPQ
jgi:RHS repeat-associated protein